MNKLIMHTMFALCIAGSAISCEQNEGGLAGPCVHNYEDPILAIKTIEDAESGEQIPRITINEVFIDSVRKDASSLVRESSQNVTIQDSSILCNVPCGFGTEAGRYQFTVHASGYEDTTMTQKNVRYENFDGGCPSSNSGSTTMSFTIEPK